MSAIKARVSCAFISLVTLVLVAAATPKPEATPPSWFWGCWVIAKSLPTAGVSGLSQKQVDAFLGTRIMFKPACARSGRTFIPSPSYSVKVLSARDFFKLGYFPLSQIGVQQQQVTEVELGLPDNVSDLNFPGSKVFLRERDIVVSVENQSFLAERAKEGGAACTCEAPPRK